jgi:hypothetical protein
MLVKDASVINVYSYSIKFLVGTCQDLSNDTNNVKIGRWEPGVLGLQRGSDKVKNIHILVNTRSKT